MTSSCCSKRSSISRTDKKNVCKPDHTKKITTLADSHGIAYAKTIRPNYDYDVMRQAVLDRWGAESTIQQEK